MKLGRSEFLTKRVNEEESESTAATYMSNKKGRAICPSGVNIVSSDRPAKIVEKIREFAEATTKESSRTIERWIGHDGGGTEKSQ